MNFTKKLITIEAVQFTGLESVPAILAFCPVFDQVNDPNNTIPVFGIPTLEGIMIVTQGDWIIKGIKGEFYPCKPDIFAASYDPADH